LIFGPAFGKFGVDDEGNLVSIRGVPLNWPTANAYGVLTNNGSGELSWLPAGGGGPDPCDSVTSETAFGQTAGAGASTEYSRGDHTHGTPDNPVPAHAALTSSVHGFDVSGDAPAQVHGTAKHTGTIGAWSQIDKATSSIGDIATRSAGDLSSGTLDGDRLPAMSTAKKGGVPATGTPSGLFLRDDSTWAAAGGGGAAPPWKGALVATWGDGNPTDMLQMMYNNPVNATPTNIGITVARIAYFRLDTAITVQKIRAFGVGATTNIYRCAIYRNSDSARLTSELVFSTTAQAWVACGSSLALALAANELYFIAVAVNATGTTAGLLCRSATTGRIGVLPTSWPGNLDIDLATPIISPFALAQFAVTSGALPATAPARAAQAAWTGGMPAFFLDANNG